MQSHKNHQTKRQKQATAAADTVYKMYARTRYGRNLERVARYERFRPHNYSVRYWERLLGSDVNNLHHMHHSIAVARWFVSQENQLKPDTFSLRENMLLAITGAMHDQAEAIIGDIPHGKKSRRERRREVEVLREYESRFEPGLLGEKLNAYRIGRNRVAFSDKSHKLAGAFEAIELIGFIQNAVAALHRISQLEQLTVPDPALENLGIHNESTRSEIITALRRLANEVLGSGVVGRLIVISPRYPSGHKFLDDHADEIDRGFSEVTHSDFAWYETGLDPYATAGESKRRYNSFLTQRERWRDWRTNK